MKYLYLDRPTVLRYFCEYFYFAELHLLAVRFLLLLFCLLCKKVLRCQKYFSKFAFNITVYHVNKRKTKPLSFCDIWFS